MKPNIKFFIVRRLYIHHILSLFFSCFLLANAVLADDGHLLWAKAIGGSSSESGALISVDHLGNVYTVGTFEGTIDFDPGSAVFNLTSSGLEDVFICKWDSYGNFIWAQSRGGVASDNGRSVFADGSGYVFIAGSYDNDAISFFSKLDSDGNVIWEKTFGGVSDGVFYSVKDIFVDGNGNVFSIGEVHGLAESETDLYISKRDNDGDEVWHNRMGAWDSNSGGNIAVDTSGNVYISARGDLDQGDCAAITTDGYYGNIISKLDSNGACLWANINVDVYYGDIMTDAAGNVYFTGNFSGTADLDFGLGVLNLTSAGAKDIFVSKYNNSGNMVWVRTMGGILTDYGNSISVDDSGNVYTTGTFHDTADFDPGPEIFNLNSLGGGDIFISKIDSDGNFVWAKSIGGTADDRGKSIAAGSSGVVYTCGDFYETVDFDPSEPGGNLTSAGEADFFIASHKFEGPGPFTLSVTARGNGLVTSDPVGISCPAQCSESFAKDTIVTLSAVPSTGSFFSSWSGGCKGSGTCKILLDRKQDVVAHFGKKGGQPWSVLLLKN